MIKGEPINTGAIQQTMPQLQQAMMMGQASPEQVQQAIEQAALSPLSFENYQTHIDVHSLYMKSAEFDQLPPDVQQRFQMHYDLTYQRFMEIKQAQLRDTIHIGSFDYPQATITFPALSDTNVGFKILREFALTFDQKNKRMKFEHAPNAFSQTIQRLER